MSILDECWEWKGARVKGGYGNRGIGGGRSALTHRLAYEWVYGPIPAGMHVLHRCDNPPCCNPAHLFLGTERDNALDKCRKGRHHSQKKTHCPSGHPYYGANLGTDGTDRTCRECKRLAAQRWRLRQKQPDTFVAPAFVSEHPIG